MHDTEHNPTSQFCAYCGDTVTPSTIGGALGRRLPLCQTCADGLSALADGADDALWIFRRKEALEHNLKLLHELKGELAEIQRLREREPWNQELADNERWIEKRIDWTCSYLDELSMP